jgi:diguanylate cyclase (GGDEF)-like protein/PAS domain S-box-containing protein
MGVRPPLVAAGSVALAAGVAAAGLASMWAGVSAGIATAAIAILLVLLAALQISFFVRSSVAESERAAETDQYRGVFHNAPLGMAILNPDATTVVANEAYALASRRGAGSSLREAVRLLGNGTEPRVRHYATSQASSDDEWQALITVVALNGGSGPRLATIEDVTEAKRDRESLEASEAQLSLQTATVEVLARSEHPDTAIPNLLRTLGEHGGWTVAAFWTLDSSDHVMRCRHTWAAAEANVPDFVAMTEQMPVIDGRGLVGSVWHTGEPTWLADITAASEGNRATRAQREGLRTAFAFPLRVAGAVQGVVEFWGKQAYDREDAFATGMTAVSTQVASYLSHDLERHRTEERVRISEERFRAITEIAQDAIVTMDETSTIVSVNRSAETMLGYSRDEMIGKSVTMLMPENLRESHAHGIQRYLLTGAKHIRWDGLELPALRKDGSKVLVHISLAEFKLDGHRTFTAYMRDITEQKQEESALVYQALHDTLTDLPNRVLMQERLERALVSAHRYRTPLGLMFMDLDRFKEVNDTMGHQSGDALLQQVAVRLQKSLRESDTVARLGGDEFAVLLPATDEPGAALTATRIMEEMSQPFVIDGQKFECGGSIGIALYPEHGQDVATLMRRADVAMYAAKRSGSGYTVYSAERDEANAMRLVMTGELRRAIDTGQLLLHYQPKINLKSGEAHEVEALIRWQHPERGFIPPDGFIPLAEETGLVKPLTAWLLSQAVKQHRVWKEAGFDIRISVNFSAKTLHDPELVEMVLALIERTGVEPSSLQVEITESALMMNPERALQTLSQLHTAGIWTSIDDFGTGYSSLGYLKQLPVDEIKIDKSFVMDMASSRDDASIVRSVVTLGHNLGLQVVAEGVENKRTLDMLADMECDLAQGFFLSRPLPAFEISEWLVARRTRALEPR